MATVLPHRSGYEEPEDPGVPLDVQRRERLASRVYSLEQLLSVETEQAQPLLGDFLRVGEVTILGGHGGQGKSTLALEMGAAVATGRDCLGAECDEPRTVVFVDLEQGVGVAQQAVMRALYPKHYRKDVPVHEQVEGIDLGEVARRIHWCDWREGADVDGIGPMFEQLEKLIDEHEPALVVMDPVYKLMLGRNVNEAEVVGQLVSLIDGIRSRHPEVAWLIPMHPRKPPMGHGPALKTSDLYGSAMWGWWASVVLLIWRGEGRTATLRRDKDRHDGDTLGNWSVFLNPEGRFQRDPKEAGDVDDRSDKRIWEWFQESPGRLFTREQIAEMLGIPHPTVIKATQKMVRMRDTGKGCRELQVDGIRPKMYGYLPPRPDPVIDGLKDEFDAYEEDGF